MYNNLSVLDNYYEIYSIILYMERNLGIQFKYLIINCLIRNLGYLVVISQIISKKHFLRINIYRLRFIFLIIAFRNY